MSSRDREAFQQAFDVSRETLSRFDLYLDLLKKWNRTINLVATSTLDQAWRRHFWDSAAAFAAAGPVKGRWLDLGSGGGFPGAVAALLADEKNRQLSVTCVEADVRKAAFLRTLSVQLAIPFHVASRRIEEVPPQGAAVVSARALTSLAKLLAFAEVHLAPGGVGIFLKGETWKDEVEEALETFRFSVENTPSPTQPGSAILVVGDIRRA